MKRLLPLAPLAAVFACGSNPVFFSNSDFSGPTGLAIASVPERDLLFIANQGSNELRAIVNCSAPANQPTTCTGNEDGQFLPGPIRVFPASIIHVGERPLRLAGLPLLDGMRGQHGAVVVAGGTDSVVRVVDAVSLFAASRDRTVSFADPSDPNRTVTLPAPAVDVVAAQTPGQTVTGVAASEAPPGGSPALTVFVASLGADGIAQIAAMQRCALDFVPTRLALIPGKLPQPPAPIDDLDINGVPQHVYVADGTPGGTPGGVGDGAVEVSIPAIPPIAGSIPACPVTRRIPASDPADSPRRARPLRSLALSPKLLLDPPPTVAPAGNFMLAVTAPDASLCADRGARTCPASIAGPGVVCADQGYLDCGGGRIVILANDPAGGRSAVMVAPGVVPIPTATDPFRTGPPMVPLRPPAPAREVAFLGRAACPTPTPSGRTDLVPPCTSARVGVTTTATPAVIHLPTIGLASTEDGSTVFIDVVARRFLNDLRDATSTSPTPGASSTILLPGQQAISLNLPGVAIDKTDPAQTRQVPGTQANGWINAGVTSQATYRIIWHKEMPGLESVSGVLSRSGTGPILLTLPDKDLTPWIASPELQLGAGDFVRVLSFSNATCADLANPPLNVDIPIAAVTSHTLELQPVDPSFDPDPACFASGLVGGTFGVFAGDSAAGSWMVVENVENLPFAFVPQGGNVLGRFPHGGQFVLTGPRVDYPLDFDPSKGGTFFAPNTFAFSFSVTGPTPTFDGTFFLIQTLDGNFPVSGQPLNVVSSVRDLNLAGAPGFAGPILVYDSPRYPNDQIVFTAITGSNSLMKAIPAQFGVPNASPIPLFMYY